MRKANVYCRGILAGALDQTVGGYRFQYLPEYLRNPKYPPISLSFPKQEAAFESAELFPFFFGLLTEGENKELQCWILKIDESDHFSRLLKTCAIDTIGAVTVEESA